MTMATPAETQTPKHNQHDDRHRRQRGRGKKRNQSRGTANTDIARQDPNLLPEQITGSISALTIQEVNDENDDLCWICAEPVKYFSVSECNHRTCHVCALRLRALYKRMDCTFCKV